MTPLWLLSAVHLTCRAATAASQDVLTRLVRRVVDMLPASAADGLVGGDADKEEEDGAEQGPGPRGRGGAVGPGGREIMNAIELTNVYWALCLLDVEAQLGAKQVRAAAPGWLIGCRGPGPAREQRPRCVPSKRGESLPPLLGVA